MNKPNHRLHPNLVGGVCSALLVVATVPVALAQPSVSKINPCPSIFYEEPHNHQVIVPQGCRPNALTRRLVAQGLIVDRSNPTPDMVKLGVGGDDLPDSQLPKLQPNQNMGSASPSQSYPMSFPQQYAVLPPPLPKVVATVVPQNGKVNVRLVNQTGAVITYQVIGNTKPRSLPGKSYVMLQGLPTPVNVTFRRQDGGLLRATPVPQAGMLDVSLDATRDLGTDKSTMSIQPNGNVSFN
ncbi:MAG: hypothetical protein H0X31_07670 [Nostocaceae cyanobacterium]|nr:hypothetical protein [Nostocaceae cyanobacterium]